MAQDFKKAKEAIETEARVTKLRCPCCERGLLFLVDDPDCRAMVEDLTVALDDGRVAVITAEDAIQTLVDGGSITTKPL